MSKLDLIVTHYTEPVNIWQPFFTMLDLQRGINFDDICVIFVQDGDEGYVGAEKLLELANKPYKVDLIGTHANWGPSYARNYGLDEATAKWVMFCDCDDMFGNPYALKNIMNVIDTDDFDILNGRFYAEKAYWRTPTELWKGKAPGIQIEHPGSIYIHCKLYRRQFLLDHDLRFPEDMRFGEDTVFNLRVNLRVPKGRCGDINAEAPLYIWTHRNDSLGASDDSYIKDLAVLPQKAMYLLPDFKKYAPGYEYWKKVATIFYDAFYHPCRTEEFDEAFLPVYRTYLEEFREVPNYIKRGVLREVIEEYAIFSGYHADNDEKAINTWLDQLKRKEEAE